MKEEFAVYQILIFATSIYFILQAVFSMLRKKKSIREAIFLMIFWLCFSILAFSPHVIEKFGSLLGFEVGANAVLTISVLLLFVIAFRLIVRLDKAEANLTKLVRQIALKEIEEKK